VTASESGCDYYRKLKKSTEKGNWTFHGQTIRRQDYSQTRQFADTTICWQDVSQTCQFADDGGLFADKQHLWVQFSLRLH